MNKRRVWTCSVVGLMLTVLPILLMTLTPRPNGPQGAIEMVLSVLVGPGVEVSRPVFGVHNLGFFVFVTLLNFLFWSGITYAIAALSTRLHRDAN